MNRFVVRFDCYDEQVIRFDAQRKALAFGYSLIREPVTMQLVRQHLEGTITLGFPAICTDGLCKWLCWDSDDDQDHLERLQAVLQKLGFTVLREGGRPGRKGHLWLLLDRPIPAADAIRFELEMRAHAKVPDKALEFFPAQTGAKISGNPVRGPLGIHRKPEALNQRGWFEGVKQDVIVQLHWLVEQPLNSAARIEAIAGRLREGDLFLQDYTRRPKWDESDSYLEPVEVFANLKPKLKTGYYECLCPSCKQRTAYFYEDGTVLLCNRRNKCKYTISVFEYSRPMPTFRQQTQSNQNA